MVAVDKGFSIKSNIYLLDDKFVAEGFKNGISVENLFKFQKEEKRNEVMAILAENKATKENPYHATFKFEKEVEAAKIKANKGDGKNYEGEFIIEEIQTEKEHNIFLFIFLLTLAFGLLVIALLKPLKRLTHGAEDNEGLSKNETEGFELAEESK